MKKYSIGLVGNPNVGKSTLFNQLTGQRQHTGNWAGKTVATAYGTFCYENTTFELVDLPGAYSLTPTSKDEEITRDYLCFSNYDAILVVCDATALERNLNLVFQILEITTSVILCINLIDEAQKKKIFLDQQILMKQLGIPVVFTSARKKKGLEQLQSAIYIMATCPSSKKYKLDYPIWIEQSISFISNLLKDANENIPHYFFAKQILASDEIIPNFLIERQILPPLLMEQIIESKHTIYDTFSAYHITPNIVQETLCKTIFTKSKEICDEACNYNSSIKYKREIKIDQIITNRSSGIPIMLLLLSFILWLTISFANIPSSYLSKFFYFLEPYISQFFSFLQVPTFIHDCIVYGVYRVVTLVISVMLPPMAIFFPLFTILEDLGYLPRVAFNLDYCFKKVNACGKQCLCMCMGLGCNAVGVTGCRIINSKREQLIAILTNSFMPCNGRFPTLIAIITIFFTWSMPTSNVFSALFLLLCIVASIIVTFFVSYILSKTVLKGTPSSFTLELPPYRIPDVKKIVVRSLFDRTLVVLWRAVCIALPASLLIWVLANTFIGSTSLFQYCTSFLDPFGQIMGLDGVILFGFLLGIPANEIVLPIILMGYLNNSTITDFSSFEQLRLIFLNNNWTLSTALCMIAFTLFHWPCSTTCLTIKKETKSFKWTSVAFFLPTLVGITLCILINILGTIFSF